jgi:hypothetical protein
MRASITTDIDTLKNIDYTHGSVDRFVIHDHGRDYTEFSSISFQELRRKIFWGIETPDLLSGVFSSITDNTPCEGSSFRKQDNHEFCGWMCPEEYKYDDGECLTLYVRDSSANDVMKDVLMALSGQSWSERLFKLRCTVEITLADERKIKIEV